MVYFVDYIASLMLRISSVTFCKKKKQNQKKQKNKQNKQTKPQKPNKKTQTNKPKKKKPKTEPKLFLSAPNIYMFEISTYIGI